jgi:hypothetical protein
MLTIIVLFALAGIVAVLTLLKVIARLLLWIRRRGEQPPYQRGLWRATAGSFLLALSIYAATWFPFFLGQSLAAMVAAFWRTPADHLGVAVFAGIVTVALAWIITGMRSARGGDRDSIRAMWSAAVSICCLCLIYWQWYLPRRPWGWLEAADSDFVRGLYFISVPWINLALKGLFIAATAAGLVRLWLTMPMLGGGNALRRILRHIQNRARRLRPARPRSF